jgi:pyruvate dehydrogenase E1 component beta subunit
MPASDQSLRHCGRGIAHVQRWAEIATRLQEDLFDYMDAPIKRVSSADVPLPYSKNIELMALPDVHKVIATIREVL